MVVVGRNANKYNENKLFCMIFPLQMADFGLSNHFQRGTLLQTYCGSPLYASPEIVKGLPYQGPEVSQHIGLLNSNTNTVNFRLLFPCFSV